MASPTTTAELSSVPRLPPGLNTAPSPIISSAPPSLSLSLAEDPIVHQSQISARRASVMMEEYLTSEFTSALPPETKTYISVIGAQSKLADGSARTATRLLKLLRERHPEVFNTPILLNAVLDCHAKCSDGSAMDCIDLLIETNSIGGAIDIVTYNTVMNVLSKCADGSAIRAYSILLEMKARNVQPNLVSYNTVIDAQSRRADGSARTALAVLDHMMADHSREIFPDLSTFTSIINLQARKDDGSAAAAFRVLDTMRSAGIAPNTIILNSVIDTQAKQRDGQARVALLVLEAMKKAPPEQDVTPNVVTYTSVIDCCAKCRDGDGTTAVRMLDEMIGAGLVPNHMTFGTVINSQAKRGSARMASNILQKMVATEAGATQVAYNSVINAHAKCEDGSAREALLILEAMKASGVQPNTITYSSCIDAQAKKRDGSAETAAQLLEESLHMGLRPDTVTFTCVLDAQAKREDGSSVKSAAILDRMLGVGFVQPNLIHFNSAINASANSRPADIRTAERILNKAIKEGLRPNNYTLSALLRCAAFANPPQPDLARQWFETHARSIKINEHIERALGNAVGEIAHDLLRSVGYTPTQAVRRASRRTSGMRSETPVRRSSSSNWRNSPDFGGSAPQSPSRMHAPAFPWNSTVAEFGGWGNGSSDGLTSPGPGDRSIPHSRHSWRTEQTQLDGNSPRSPGPYQSGRTSVEYSDHRGSVDFAYASTVHDMSSLSFGTNAVSQYGHQSGSYTLPSRSSNGFSTGPGGSGGTSAPLSPTAAASTSNTLPSAWANFGVEPSAGAPCAGPATESRALPHQSWAAVGQERDSRRRSGAQQRQPSPPGGSADGSLFEARRLSLVGSDIDSAPPSPGGSSRRNSLAGIHASQAAAEPRLSSEVISDLTNALGAGSRRLSLSEKIQKIKADGSVPVSITNHSPLSQGTYSPIGTPPTRSPSRSPLTQRAASPISLRSSSPVPEKSSMLLGPSFITKGSPRPSSRSPTLSRASQSQNIVRMPEGPDGTRGFGNRRLSMVTSTQQ